MSTTIIEELWYFFNLVLYSRKRVILPYALLVELKNTTSNLYKYVPIISSLEDSKTRTEILDCEHHQWEGARVRMRERRRDYVQVCARQAISPQAHGWLQHVLSTLYSVFWCFSLVLPIGVLNFIKKCKVLRLNSYSECNKMAEYREIRGWSVHEGLLSMKHIL